MLFENQRLRVFPTEAFQLRHTINRQKDGWAIDIEATINKAGTLVATEHALDSKLFHEPFFPQSGGNEKKRPREYLEEALTSMLSANASIVTMLTRFTGELWPLMSDLSGGKIYNIVPSAVKLPEDSAKPPGIERDGSGLAATLYALQRSNYPESFSPWYYVLFVQCADFLKGL